MDPKKQTEFVGQTEEIASQFDYTHSQINKPGLSSKRQVEPEKPVDSKIYHPIYWLTILCAVVLYSIIASYLSTLLTYAIYVVMLVIMYATISKLKKRASDRLTPGDKYKMVLFMAFEPIVGQAMYYYRLRKKMPKSASIALGIGWKVFALVLLGLAIYVFISTTQSWQYRYSNTFQMNIDKISADLNAITADAKEYDTLSLIANCKQLSSDINATKKMPAFPVSSTQAKLTDALNTLDKGAKNCQKSLRFEDPPLLQQSNKELNNGFDKLKQAVQQINSN